MESMDDMDLLSGSNTHLSKMSSEGNMVGTAQAMAAQAAAQAAATNANATVTTPAQVSGQEKVPFVTMGSLSGAANPPLVKYRNVGKSGLKISNIGLGSMKLFSHEKPEVAEAMVTSAMEQGINFFDVSDPYQQVKKAYIAIQ